MKTVYEKLPGVLLPWYRENKRQLPWRQDRDPYKVWVSEIMLQQTRVEAVKGYYTRFLDALPTVQALAACPDDQLHKLWEGLGYYNRVRNMKKAAGVILERYGGEFPGEYEALLSLPGVGEYTAGAISSICFNKKVPAVDGNVLRVAARLENDSTPIDLPQRKKAVKAALEQVYPQRAGDFTQALMELGATLCGPNKKAECDCCPCRAFCLAHLAGNQDALPVKSKGKKRRLEEKTVFILQYEDQFALCRRENKGLLAGLWQFPDVPGILEMDQALQFLEAMGIRVKEILRQTEKNHIFTHIQWKMRGIYVRVHEPGGNFIWLSRSSIGSFAALPTAYRQFYPQE